MRLLPYFTPTVSPHPTPYDAIRSSSTYETTDEATAGYGRDSNSTGTSYEPSKRRHIIRTFTTTDRALPRIPATSHNAADHALGEFTAPMLASDGVDCSSVEGACALSCDECGPTSHPTMRYDMNSRGHRRSPSTVGASRAGRSRPRLLVLLLLE